MEAQDRLWEGDGRARREHRQRIRKRQSRQNRRIEAAVDHRGGQPVVGGHAVEQYRGVREA